MYRKLVTSGGTVALSVKSNNGIPTASAIDTDLDKHLMCSLSLKREGKCCVPLANIATKRQGKTKKRISVHLLH
jgi:hypothetical protein